MLLSHCQVIVSLMWYVGFYVNPTNICNFFAKVRPDLESQSQQKFSSFQAVKFKSQVVAGTNFFIKVHFFACVELSNKGVWFPSVGWP